VSDLPHGGGQAPRSIDTFGWDTAFALKVSDVNRLLRSGAPTPESFKFTHRAVGGEWSFAPWNVSEASGSQICLALRFAGASLRRKGRTLPLADAVCAVTCEMVLKPLNRSGGRTTNVPTPRPRASTKWALVEVVDDQDALLLPERADLQKFLDEWFRTPEALGEFERQFAGIRIDTVIADDDLAWLSPRAIGFAGAVSPDGDPLFGILARTLRDDVTGCPYQLSPYAIPEGAHAGLAISAETFLSQLMLPALGHVFMPGSDDPAGHFSIHDRNKLRNTTRLDVPFTTKDGAKYTGSIAPNQFDVALTGDVLTITIHDMTVPVDLGPIRDVATMHLRVEYRLGLRLAAPKDDPRHTVLTLFERAPPTVTDSTQKKLGLQIAEISIEIAGAILAAVAAYFAQRVLGNRGVKPFVTKLVAALTMVIVGIIGDRIAHIPDGIIADFEAGALKKLPDFSRFVAVALGNIRWPKDVRYRAVSAEFCDCALIGIALEETGKP
jgi:Clostridium P-47 protein